MVKRRHEMKEDYLQNLREERGISQRRLAHAVGISRGRLRRLEDGEIESITYRELKEICLALGLKPEDFFQPDALDGSQPVLRRAGESAFKIKVSGAGYELLSLLPSSEDLFAGKIFVLPKKKLSPKETPQAKKIYITTLVGLFRIEVAGKAYELHPGDSLLFDGSGPYSLENPTLRESAAFFVTVPGLKDFKNFTSSLPLSSL